MDHWEVIRQNVTDVPKEFDKKTLIGMTKRLIKNFGNLADEAYKENPDWKRVFRGKYELQHKKGWEHALDNLKNYRFSGKENIGEKIKVGTKLGRSGFFRDFECH